jgi:hypothetical protein
MYQKVNFNQSGMIPPDKHWSGDIYSPEFISYDKWGFSKPTHLYGAAEEKMAPRNTARSQEFPIQVKNYELLKPGIQARNEMNNSQDQKMEKFEMSKENYDWVIVLVLLFLVYMFDKAFGNHMQNLSFYYKLGIIGILVVILFYFLR